MPALTNPKHERFAQELASGKSADESYVTAGYRPNRGNAGVLRHKKHISIRVAEILAGRESIHAQATAEAIKSAALTKQWVIEQLMTVSERTMQAKPVLDRKGAPVMVETPSGSLAPAFVFDSSGANRSLELLGKELGMFVDRSISENVNTNYVVSGDPVDSAEDWEAEHTPTH
jgi:phage terminase small subunit